MSINLRELDPNTTEGAIAVAQYLQGLRQSAGTASYEEFKKEYLELTSGITNLPAKRAFLRTLGIGVHSSTEDNQ